jgi:hypothetical protein
MDFPRFGSGRTAKTPSWTPRTSVHYFLARCRKPRRFRAPGVARKQTRFGHEGCESGSVRAIRLLSALAASTWTSSRLCNSTATSGGCLTKGTTTSSPTRRKSSIATNARRRSRAGVGMARPTVCVWSVIHRQNQLKHGSQAKKKKPLLLLWSFLLLKRRRLKRQMNRLKPRFQQNKNKNKTQSLLPRTFRMWKQRMLNSP